MDVEGFKLAVAAGFMAGMVIVFTWMMVCL